MLPLLNHQSETTQFSHLLHKAQAMCNFTLMTETSDITTHN
jgi:hypothetical protein